eukprot:CAMPEP_0202903670 /NCGR_PEP_ID=MMETSP1392-20130828/25713_1 /ASSEMBLY_ACC=CAM_ASM_000868 /TAXON_ID=225041 /ORGANISM="Chlamydomonas chlamydogama, Strain SAG 11-48b" /LENGTH=30 /DNA_ID= /DNA_START= /DNA_END= /DNA_ORIENTATION=
MCCAQAPMWLCHRLIMNFTAEQPNQAEGPP